MTARVLTWSLLIDQTSYGYPAYRNGSLSDCNTEGQNPEDGVLSIRCVDCDSDGINDDLDNCPANPNANQEEADGDGIGDVCDSCTDIDGDGFGNPGFPTNACPSDNCPDTYNVAQADADADCIGNVCDPEPEVYDSSVPDVYPHKVTASATPVSVRGILMVIARWMA